MEWSEFSREGYYLNKSYFFNLFIGSEGKRLALKLITESELVLFSKSLFGLIKMEVRFPCRAGERNVSFSGGRGTISHSASFGQESQVLRPPFGKPQWGNNNNMFLLLQEFGVSCRY